MPAWIKKQRIIKKLTEALGKETLYDANKEMFDNVTAKNSNKAAMALELLYLTEPSKLEPPAYISVGLKWLEDKLAEKKQDLLATPTKDGKDVWSFCSKK